MRTDVRCRHGSGTVTVARSGRSVVLLGAWLVLFLLLLPDNNCMVQAATALQDTANKVTATTPEQQQADAWFEAADTNHDQTLSKPEVRAAYTDLLNTASSGSGGSSWFSFLWNREPETSESGSSAAAAASTDKQQKTTTPDNFWKSFSSAVAMIVATELGDKTFFIAAVLSMKHDRGAVLLGAVSALAIMTVLSTAMGLVLPQLMSRRYTTYVSIMLFLYFGVKLLHEGSQMKAGQTSEELEEVEEELLLQSSKKEDDVVQQDEERGQAVSSAPSSSGSGVAAAAQQKDKRRRKKKKQKASTAWYRVALQALTLTFVAEWGDRSQIATIALAAYHDPVGVTIGGCLGHLFCTGLAVVGGRMLAARISEKTVALSGGVLFLLFGLHSLAFETL